MAAVPTVSILNVPKHTIEEVAKALGLPPATPRSWVTYEWLMLSEHDRRGQRGIAALLTPATALQMGTANELVGLGFTPEHALYAARAFSGTNGCDVDHQLKRISGRAPASLFNKDRGETLLVAWKPFPIDEETLKHPSPLDNEAALVMLAKGGVPLSLFNKMAGGRLRQESLVVVSCNRVCENLSQKLGMEVVYS